MKKLTRNFLLLFIALAGISLAMIDCGNMLSSSNGGSGTEVVGNVQKDSTTSTKKLAKIAVNVPANGALVYFYLSGSVPSSVPSASCDANGNFTVYNVSNGTWVIKVILANGHTNSISIFVDGKTSPLNIGTIVVN